jgi:hypothetical protein
MNSEEGLDKTMKKTYVSTVWGGVLRTCSKSLKKN